MDDVWLLVRWLHIVAMAFFVGGQLVVAAAVVPVLRGREDPETLRAIARRFGQGSLVAILVLLATGVAMAEHFRRWSDGTLQLKLGLIALTGVLIGWHIRRPTAHALAGAVFVLSLVLVWLGLSLAHA